MTGRRDEHYYTVEEVIAILKSFTQGDLLKLERLARLWAGMLRGCEPEDLVQMVMSRLLAGTRRWPRDVAKEAFFVEAMRSCADQYSYDSTLQARSLVFESETVADDEDQTPVEKAKANVSNPGEVLEYSQEIERIQKHFENSEVELGVIMWRAEEYSPEEIQQEFSLTPTQYASTLKKIRRYVLRTRKE